MLASRAIAQFRLGEFEEAATWAVKAAARPNAHNHALAVAAQCLGMAGRVGEAQAFLTTIAPLPRITASTISSPRSVSRPTRPPASRRAQNKSAFTEAGVT